MKKTMIIAAGVILLASIATPAFAATTYPKIVVSQKTNTATAPSETITPSPAPAEEYVLPYPGMLPDSPLYFLKTLRDRVMEFLVTDPVRKIDFYVLESDKDLNAGILLGLENKKSFVMTTFTQSLKDMGKAVSLATSMKGQGKMVTSDSIDHMAKSLAKHEQVLIDFVSKTSGTEKDNFDALVTQIKSFESEVAKLK